MTTSHISIDFHFDLICPWCLIGMRHLETAIQALQESSPGISVEVDWRSNLLLPEIPVQGVSYQAFYENRLGSQAAIDMRRAQVQAAASQAGIVIAFERIRFMPNTLKAHLLLEHASRQGTPAQTGRLIERLFTAFFLDGEDIGDAATLCRIGSEFGLEPSLTSALFTAAEQGKKQLSSAAPEGISGVPCFTFDHRRQLSGAHPPETLLAAIRETLASKANAA